MPEIMSVDFSELFLQRMTGGRSCALRMLVCHLVTVIEQM